MSQPDVRYLQSRDGATIAFYDMGEGMPLVISPNLWSHLTASWTGDGRTAALRLIDEGFRLIRYDMRGMGMSESDVDDFSLEAQVGDLEALADRLGLQQFVLFGVVCGTPPSIAYAARHPERLTHLVLNTPFADGDAWYRATPTLQGLESFRAMGAEQWHLYIKTHATALAGMVNAGDPNEMADYMAQSATPPSLGGYLTALRSFDVSGILADVRTPTLAFTTGGEQAISFARRVVSAIRGSRLVAVPPARSVFVVPSPHHVPEIVRFVFGREPEDAAQPPMEAIAHGTAIVVFADIADSTGLTERLGDATFREKARALDRSLRGAVVSSGGSVIDAKTLGDGILATFAAASQAIAAAIAFESSAQAVGLSLHVGIHAGDVIREDGNVFGGAVNVAARISALSEPGEVLVSATVRELARTSAGCSFDDRGEQTLRGVSDPVRVFAVRGDFTPG